MSVKHYLLTAILVGVCLCFSIQSVVRADSAADAFLTFTEYTEDGRVFPLQKGLTRYDVDINSSIDVSLSPEVLVKTYLPPASINQQLQQQVEELNKLLIASRHELQGYVQNITTLYAQLRSNPTPELHQEFRKQIASHGALIETLLDLLEPIVGSDQLERALSTPDPAYTGLFDLLAAQIREVQQRLTSENREIMEKNKLVINLWCLHQSKSLKPVMIHLNNYDNLASGAVQMINKLAMTPKDQEYLQKSLAFHENLRDVVKELPEQQDEIKQMSNELKKQLETSAKIWADGFNVEVLRKVLTDLKKEITIVSSGEHFANIAVIAQELELTFQTFIGLRIRYNELLQALNEWSTSDPLLFYATVSEKWNAFQTDIVSVLQSNAADQIAELVENLDRGLRESDLLRTGICEKVIELQENVKNWFAGLAKVEEDVIKKQVLADLSPAMVSLLSRLSLIDALTTVPAGNTIPDEIRQVALAEAQPTMIDISRTLREEGDTYTLYVRVSRAGQNLCQEEYHFKVKRYGIYATWNSSLIFLQGAGDRAFRPATGVSWVLHYRSRSQQRWSAAFLDNILNPGLGFSSTMFYAVDRIEYGLGVTATFFNDFLQIGYGLNFQRTSEEGRGYIFIGASLFDFLNKSQDKL